MKPFEFIDDEFGDVYITISSPNEEDIRECPIRKDSVKILFNNIDDPAKAQYRFVFKEDIKRFLNYILENIEEYIA